MDLPDTLQEFAISSGRTGRFHSLPALERAGFAGLARMPISLRIILESILRCRDDVRVTREHIKQLASWQPTAIRATEIPFVVSRILLQDFTGVPLLCDLAAMRCAAMRLGRDGALIAPRIPVDMVIDHSVQVDHYNSAAALDLNLGLEFQRNHERYRFIKWGMQAFRDFSIIPPGIGIVHQVNLEHLSRPLWQRDGLYYPDTVVGTDSHTTMINGLGVVGWGVGGIEAEAAMLGQPLYFLMPDVVGVHLHGALPAGTTSTDLVLHMTEFLRAINVVGKFVECFGAGAAALSVPDRATVSNMAPEYGATMGFFPADGQTLDYLTATGRDPEDIAALSAYLRAQGLFGMPHPGTIDYSAVVELDLSSVVPNMAGPRRPQDRMPIGEVKERFLSQLIAPLVENGFGKSPLDPARRHPIGDASRGPSQASRASIPLPASPGPARALDTKNRNEAEMAEVPVTVDAVTASPADPRIGALDIGHGDVLIAAITSCTNTSNPGVMLAAGLLAKKAVERGLTVGPRVKTSLAPGSRVVATYLQDAGLLPYLEQLGFWITAYGCTTCIGNSGPLPPLIEEAIAKHQLVCAAVLSGNRNFEARIHPSIQANFLMSPPLVVALAIAGRVLIDLDSEPLGIGTDGQPVFLRELWPTTEEIASVMHYAHDPAVYRARYRDLAQGNLLWNAIPAPVGAVYAWETSSYIAEPPFFEHFALAAPSLPVIRGARALALLGDSVTTDHISPAGAIDPASPAGRYLLKIGVAPADFNSYGSRRGNHEVMVRGTFANARIRNLMLPPGDGGAAVSGARTLAQPSGRILPIYDAAMEYAAKGIPSLVFAGEEYGTGSSRDWAAKGTRLLGVAAVVARSFERIHRSNLVGMGVLPLQFKDGEHLGTIPIIGDELFDLMVPEEGLRPLQDLDLVITRADGRRHTMSVRLRIDTPIEVEYFRHGGILPYALREVLK